MALSLKELTEQALNLPASSRAQLSEQLVESLANPDESPAQKAWATEAVRRRDELKNGSVQAIPGNEVLDAARRVVGR